MVKEDKVKYDDKRLIIRHIANHYYIPVILSDENERIEFIKHIIQTPSEVKFLNRLEEYLTKGNNRFKEFDWWSLSKLDESLDEIYIPYYDGQSNKLREFKPDFIFWLQKGVNYFVVFVDPKGTEHTDYQRKIGGYSVIFENKDKVPRTIHHNGHKVKLLTYLYTDDVDRLTGVYKRYWFEDIEKVLGSVLANG